MSTMALPLRRLLALLCIFFGNAGAAPAGDLVRFPATGGEQTVLSVHAATDLVAMEPLIRDFQAVAPNVAVEFTEYVTNDLFAAAQTACEAGRTTMDVIVSSSVDQLVKLVNDGCALPHPSAGAARIPDWARWRDEVFGFTVEPAVIVYRRDLVSPEEVPRTRTELVELLRSRPDKYDGRIGTYDIAQSGIGYLFAAYDARIAATYGRLVEAFGRAHVVTRCCTTDLVEDLTAGRLLIGYNLLGSYAYGALKRGAPIGIIIPRDYTVVLSRAVLVPAGARQPAAAFRFLDYLLSERGQRKAREASFYFDLDMPLPDGVDGPATLSISGLFNPVTVGPELLALQDRAKRERFLAEWRRSTQANGAASH